MKILDTSIVYENPIPQLRSKQGIFPFFCRTADGKIAATYVIGEAFESADQTSYISFSEDEGKTWSAPQKMYDTAGAPVPFSDCSKPARLPDGSLMTLGYAFYRPDPDAPLGNPENGGLLDDFVFYSRSFDNGKTWSALTEIPCSWGPHIEASAPLTVMHDGTLITPITGFPGWDGKMTGKVCGRALRSEDGGKTWNDDAVCMEFPGGDVLCYEQRICELASGTLVCIAWNENTTTGERMENHITFSEDGGKTWSAPMPTGIRGQASSVCAIGGEKMLALHAIRRDTDRPGVYGYIVDFSEKQWKITDTLLLWEPALPLVKDTKLAEIFSFVKFGQPGAILLDENTALMSHWYCEQGQYKVMATKIQL